MKWTLVFLCVLLLALFWVRMKPEQKLEPKAKATLVDAESVINNFPPLLHASEFMKFHEASLDENDVGHLSRSITERATRSYKDHAQKIIFFPNIATEDVLLARDQMNELRQNIDAAVGAELKIARSLVWARPLSTTVTKWSESENHAKESALALLQSIQLLENK